MNKENDAVRHYECNMATLSMSMTILTSQRLFNVFILFGNGGVRRAGREKKGEQRSGFITDPLCVRRYTSHHVRHRSSKTVRGISHATHNAGERPAIPGDCTGQDSNFMADSGAPAPTQIAQQPKNQGCDNQE